MPGCGCSPTKSASDCCDANASAGWPPSLKVGRPSCRSTICSTGTSVVIRTVPGAKLEEAPLTAVAFEIDDADRYGHWAWSVLVQGPAFDITSSADELSEQDRQ